MAGERIFMRTDLERDPRVRRLASLLRSQVPESLTRSQLLRLVIGNLHWFWGLADGFTDNGDIRHLTPSEIDDDSLPGFAAALAEVGWLEVTEDGVRLPKFTEYNGKSAKKRLRDAQRIFEKRLGKPPRRRRTATESGQMSPDARHSGVESATSERPASGTGTASTTTTPRIAPKRDAECEGFGAFWEAFPRKVDKAAALKVWNKLAPDEALRATIMTALAVQAPAWVNRIAAGEAHFVPHAATWLSHRRWEDQPDQATGYRRAGSAQIPNKGGFVF